MNPFWYFARVLSGFPSSANEALIQPEVLTKSSSSQTALTLGVRHEGQLNLL